MSSVGSFRDGGNYDTAQRKDAYSVNNNDRRNKGKIWGDMSYTLDASNESNRNNKQGAKKSEKNEWYGDKIISGAYDSTTVTVILVISTTRRLITTDDPGELMIFTLLSLLVALGLDLIRRGLRTYMASIPDNDWKYYGKPLSSLYHFACQAETYVLLLQVSTISVWFDVAPMETTTSLKLLIMLTIFLFTGIFLLVWGNVIPSTRPPRRT